jgi:plasmid replication initiation protein
MDNLKKLQDEAAEIANRIDAVRAMECESDADIAARDMDLTALVKRADDITGKIDFERKVAESATNIRSVVDRCTPAREQEETRQVARIEPITTAASCGRSTIPKVPTASASGSLARSSATLTPSVGASITASKAVRWARARPLPAGLPCQRK